MGLEEVCKRHDENQRSISWKHKVATQLFTGNEQISLSSVHEKAVSTWEYLTQALLWELMDLCDHECNAWI